MRNLLRGALCASAAAVCLAGPLLSASGQTAPITKEQWREDLKYFAKELPKRHKNAFHATTREAFERAIASLDADIPSLQDHQIIVRLHQITATIGDGHTGVHMAPSFKRLPINLYWFGRDLRVVAASKEYERALGARVLKIGGMDIDGVETRIRTCFASAENENTWHTMSTGPAFMARTEMLHALGIIPDVSRAAFTLQAEDGTELVLDIAPIEMPAPSGGVLNLSLLPVWKAPPPLYRQKVTEPFWYTQVEGSETVYANFRRYTGLGDNAKAMFKFIDSHPTSRLIIDLRQNGGGDYFEGREHLVEPVKKRPAINQKGRLYVIIGRATFSAAMVNAIDFRKGTNAILVGEPIGERPNSYSENDEMTLPNSRLVVSYSTRYYKFLDEDVPAVEPDMRIDAVWADFRAGKDTVMDWILAQPVGAAPPRERYLRPR